MAVAGCLGIISQAGATNHTISCNGTTKGQLEALINGGTVKPGDMVLITGFCVGDLYVPGGIKLTNHGNSPAISASDGIQGQLTVGASEYGTVFINGLTLKGYIKNSGELANLWVGPAGRVQLSYSNVSSAQENGIFIKGGNVNMQGSEVDGNGVAGVPFNMNGIAITDGGILDDVSGTGTSTISANKGYGISVNGGYVNLSSTGISSDALGEIYELTGGSEINFSNGTIATTAAWPAIQLYTSSSINLRNASVAANNGALVVRRGSSASLLGSTLTNTTAKAPTIAVGASSSLDFAGGNTVANPASGGVAIQVERESSVTQTLGSQINPAFNNVPDNIVGEGVAAINSSFDLGQGLIGSNPTLTWRGNIEIYSSSFLRMQGGVAVTGNVTLANNSGANFVLTNGGTNSVRGGVSCPNPGTVVSSYVANPTNVIPNVKIGTTPPSCSLD
ncbi:MAG TPA: hypothetical protein VK660_00960 [Xanthomonadaceae bacterium]|nr:hypothetical protein [Xanthomonadaceae bacterium]